MHPKPETNPGCEPTGCGSDVFHWQNRTVSGANSATHLQHRIGTDHHARVNPFVSFLPGVWNLDPSPQFNLDRDI